MPPTPIPSAPSWLHQTLTALATALAVSTRTLENWRPRGAPIPAEGPYDELAVRLWALSLPARGRALKLSDPPPALAPYIAQASTLKAARTPRSKADPRSAFLKQQTANLTLKNQETRARLLTEAQSTASRVIGRHGQAWVRRINGQLPARLRELAQGPADQAEARLAAELRAVVSITATEALSGDGA